MDINDKTGDNIQQSGIRMTAFLSQSAAFKLRYSPALPEYVYINKSINEGIF